MDSSSTTIDIDSNKPTTNLGDNLRDTQTSISRVPLPMVLVHFLNDHSFVWDHFKMVNVVPWMSLGHEISTIFVCKSQKYS